MNGVVKVSIRDKKFVTSDFICQECGFKFPLPRRKFKQREKGHIKDIYCPKCNKITKFKEIRFNDFIDDEESLVGG